MPSSKPAFPLNLSCSPPGEVLTAHPPTAQRLMSTLPISDRFPRYTGYDPLIPVWCITPDVPGCIHRFFDTSPVSPSGRYVAVFQLPFEDRLPEPGEAGTIRVIDLH